MEDYITSRQLSLSINVDYSSKDKVRISYSPTSGDYTILFTFDDDEPELFKNLISDDDSLLFFLKRTLDMEMYDDLTIQLCDGDKKSIWSTHSFDMGGVELNDRRKIYKERWKSFDKKLGKFLKVLKTVRGLTPNKEDTDLMLNK